MLPLIFARLTVYLLLLMFFNKETQTKIERLFFDIGGSFVLTVDTGFTADKTSKETTMALMTFKVPLNWKLAWKKIGLRR